MGLLSRKKTTSNPPPAPAISAPLATPAASASAPVEYAQPAQKVTPSAQAYPDHSAHKYPVQSSGLPSPPRSPVDELGYSHASAPSGQQHYSTSSRGQHEYPSQPKSDYYGGSSNGYQPPPQHHQPQPQQQQHGNGRNGYEVEHKMDAMSLGKNGSRHGGDHMSVDMPEQQSQSSAYYDQRQPQPQSHQQQQSYGYSGQQSAPQQQAARQPEISVLSPTPSATSSMSRKTSSRYNLTDFTFIRTLGTGSFGRVHLVRSQHNSRSYAIKVLTKERVVKMKQVEHTNSEREMLERVRHPFLVNLWGTFKDSKNLYMVMDFVAGGELFSLLRKSQRFPDPVAKFFAAEVALALDYLHSLDIIYRDLKPENILLAADGHVKITDFGFAKHVPDITWTLCGTPDYLAPEIVQSRGYNKSVDWYALGVLMFEMLAGYPPFFTEDSNPMRLYEKIIAGRIRYPAYFAPEAKDLLKSLLTPDITKRFGNLANGSRDIFGHVWFQEVDWERLYRKEIPAPYVPKVEGDWDASNFDAYPEVDLSEYGSTGPDPHGHLFPAF
ncbi:cAMP-dependent protein kinase [Sporobolomyces koalae]|uniref:cAMP-dependent protein kinase n=1 Tax=Sporobolomyces koalae TaxID=500713 RepID=UPI0031807FF3